MWETHRTRAEMFHAGMTRRQITALVRAGELIRARRDHYLPADAPDAVVRAVRVGGRLTCLSLLEMLGVFVLENSRLHVHLTPSSSRMRSPHNRKKRLDLSKPHGTRLHWEVLPEDPGNATCVDIVVALAQAMICQSPRAAVASLDSALNKKLLTEAQVPEVFALVPARYSALRPLIDGRSQSGPETFVRLILRALGCTFDLQVEFDDVGFVDLVVDGWLVIECDSRQHHSDWAQQLKDYRRDLALARRGYAVLRLTAQDIMHRPDEVMQAIAGLTARNGR
ncbi:hypothetical protein RS82_03086 [Microbacterium trichothecenolyticum]|uniref:Restriction endonuclease type II-like domain-containing protein n=3 Tax=Microbacterium TaxID=33882 RepID=A0A0M2HAH6_MICTR|nr:hypothetical protein RS82_03086 [Microbacterium trichothecenolyticum]